MHLVLAVVVAVDHTKQDLVMMADHQVVQVCWSNGKSGDRSGSNAHRVEMMESPPAGWGGSGGIQTSPWSSAAGGGSGGDATNRTPANIMQAIIQRIPPVVLL